MPQPTVGNYDQRQRFEETVGRIGKPLYRGENYAIFYGNSLELLPEVPDNAIDLTFTSPPYNIGKEYESVLPVDQFVHWCVQWLSEIHRLTNSSGALLLNLGYLSVENKGKNVPISYLLWDKIQFFLQQEIVWNYGAGVAAKHFLSPRNEKILWCIKNPESYCFNLDDIRDPDVAYPNQKKNGKLRCNSLGKNPSDVWQIAKVTSGENRASAERTAHPAQFPLDLCERVIKGFSKREGIVLDPFLGSGSTLAACSRWSRFSIGFEIRKDYCAIAAARLSNAQELF